MLLSNPNATPAAVTLTYLREGGGTITRTRTMPAGTRLTVNVAIEDPSLAATSVATRVTSDLPHRRRAGDVLADDAGVVERGEQRLRRDRDRAPRWGLAEGRVGGPFAFQTFVLVANPDATAANMTLTFLRTTGAPIVKTFVGARRRPPDDHHRARAALVPELADESFGVVMASDRPVFAERALYSNASGVFWAAGSAATATPLP